MRLSLFGLRYGEEKILLLLKTEPTRFDEAARLWRLNTLPPMSG
jgi:hypothetical protein